MQDHRFANLFGWTHAEEMGGAAGRAPLRALALMGLCLISVGSLACAGPLAGEKTAPSAPSPSGAPAPAAQPPSPPPPPQAAESWRTLRLRLEPPRDPSDALARELAFALETALVQAGFQMVLDPAAPVDARLEVASALHSVGLAVHGTAFLAVEGDGVLVDRVATEDGFYRRDRFAGAAARELVIALLGSPRMASFTSRHAPRPTPPVTG